MEHYEKGEVTECQDVVVDLPTLSPDAMEMTVKSGSKVRNLLAPALKHLAGEEGGVSPMRQVVWRGSAKTLSKAISCAELTKQRCPHPLHQITRIFYKRIEEYYEPKLANLERLRVVREVPAIVVVLSRDPLPSPSTDATPPAGLLGYQVSTTPVEMLCGITGGRAVLPGVPPSSGRDIRGRQHTAKVKRSSMKPKKYSRLSLALPDVVPDDDQ